jgi:hypothetical protein
MPARSPKRAAASLIDELRRKDFPFDRLCVYPISALEGVGVERNGAGRAVCAVGCLACCADALRPSEAGPSVTLLTPNLLGRVLTLLQELHREGLHVLSTGRLNLFSGSNELDQPYCVALRELLSAYLEQNYGFALGYTSSDIAFHASRSPTFRNNLTEMLRRSETWDNICFSIDEQIPMVSRQDYERYLENLAWVWRTIVPALESRVPHAKPLRQGGPRVILNLLVPGESDVFQPEHEALYAGGPRRATSFEALTERYILPFAGDLEIVRREAPEGHYFTSFIGRLGGNPSRLVYVGQARYAMTGRAEQLVQPGRPAAAVEYPAVRTKLVPVGPETVRIQARLTTTPVSEDEMEPGAGTEPEWFSRMNGWRLNLEPLAAWQPAVNRRAVFPLGNS